jgi:hypothetical protein
MAEHIEAQKRVCSQGHLRFLKTIIGFPTWINGHFFNQKQCTQNPNYMRRGRAIKDNQLWNPAAPLAVPSQVEM